MQYCIGNILELNDNNYKKSLLILNKFYVETYLYLRCFDLETNKIVFIPKFKNKKICFCYYDDVEVYKILKDNYYIKTSYVDKKSSIDIKGVKIDSVILDEFDKIAIKDSVVNNKYVALVGYYNNTNFNNACKNGNVLGYELLV